MNRAIGELILQAVRDIPGPVRHFAVVNDDRSETLPAQATGRLDVRKPQRMDLEIDDLVGERIPDPPGERAGPPASMAALLA